ncbi:MAG TPA: serine hydrolase domain-containing protein [Burkholderiaceae bacterium]|nr:serine hydrolase domain-containing protein [Burkholderiaceae bacterium]
MRSKAAWFAGAVIAAVAAVFLLWPRPAEPPAAGLQQELEQIVAKTVAGDAAVRNCVLSVMTGDGSFEWTGAAGVARHGDASPMTADTPVYIASVTKLYTVTAILVLQERGALSLDEPMAKYLPSQLIRGVHRYNGLDYSDRITIRQLASHRSGIADYYEEKGSDGKSLFELLEEQPGRTWTVDDTIARARTLPAHFVPGTQTFYSDTNFQLLGKIIEAVTGKPLHAVFQEFFFDPLHLTHTRLGRTGPGASSNPADVFHGGHDITEMRGNDAYWADGGIVSTAREMNVFLKALAEGRIIRPESVQSLHDWHPWQFPLRYGLGTMYFDLPRSFAAASGLRPLWGHSGSTGSFLYRSDDLDLYMAGTLDQTESKVKAFLLMRQVMRVFEARRRGQRAAATERSGS